MCDALLSGAPIPPPGAPREGKGKGKDTDGGIKGGNKGGGLGHFEIYVGNVRDRGFRAMSAPHSEEGDCQLFSGD